MTNIKLVPEFCIWCDRPVRVLHNECPRCLHQYGHVKIKVVRRRDNLELHMNRTEWTITRRSWINRS